MVTSADPWALAGKVERLGDLWPWLGGATVLGIAALSGSVEAFGLTLGVLAAMQATWGGLRVERATAEVGAITRAVERADRLERLARIDDALFSIEIADDEELRPSARGADLWNETRKAYEAASGLGLPETKRLVDLLLAYRESPAALRELRAACTRVRDETRAARA